MKTTDTIRTKLQSMVHSLSNEHQMLAIAITTTEKNVQTTISVPDDHPLCLIDGQLKLDTHYVKHHSQEELIEDVARCVCLIHGAYHGLTALTDNLGTILQHPELLRITDEDIDCAIAKREREKEEEGKGENKTAIIPFLSRQN